MTHPDDVRLNDYVDGRLPPGDAAELGAHLERCDVCKGRVEALRKVMGRLGALPGGIAPRRDVRPPLPGRASGADAGRRPGAAGAGIGGVAPAGRDRAGRPGRPAQVGPSLRAAAVVALLVGAGAGVWFGLVRSHEPATPPAASPAAAVAPGDPVIEAYARAAGKLAGAVRARRAELSPEAVRALDANLAAVDAAIRELERARATAGPTEEGPRAGAGQARPAAGATQVGRAPVADPAALDRHLEARYRTKLELLRSALELLEAS